MDILPLIKKRRSVRGFKDDKLPMDVVMRIIEAGRHAPSSGNLQNWHFIIVDDREIINSLMNACYDQNWIATASHLIVVVGDPHKAEIYYTRKGVRYTVQNCAAATQNMILEATSLGIGSCWIGAYNDEEIKDILAIEKDKTVEAVVAIGVQDKVEKEVPKYVLEQITHLNKWRNKIRNVHKFLGTYSKIIESEMKDVASFAKKESKNIIEKAKPYTKKAGDYIKSLFSKKQEEKKKEDNKTVKKKTTKKKSVKKKSKKKAKKTRKKSKTSKNVKNK